MERGTLDEHRLRRVTDVGRALVSQLDLESVLQEVVEVARELTGARYAALGVLDEDRRGLERFIHSGMDEETRELIGELPRGRGVLGELIRHPEPLRLREIGEHPRSFGFPPGHPRMRSFLGVPIVVRGQAYGNLYLAEKPDEDFDESDEEAVTILAEWASIAIFNTRLLGHYEEERNALQRAVHALEATSEIARAVGGETDRELVLETIAKRTRALVGARSLLVLMTRDGGAPEVVAAAGECGSAPVGRIVALDPPTSGGAVQAVSDLGLDARAALLAALTFRGRMLGWLIALDRLEEGPEFFTDDERLLIAASSSAAAALSTVQSASEDLLRSTLMSAERERSRWARELHDSILQGLGSRRLLLCSALRQEDGERLESTVRDVVEELSRDIEELRALITDLRPATLDQLGLAAALEDLAERFEAPGFELRSEISISDDGLDAELQTVVYRVVQEALTNAAKHARPGVVEMRVTAAGGEVEVLVADDGCGFDPAEESGGFGLVGMRERVELAFGRLRIESTPGSGTAVRAAIPVAASGAAVRSGPARARR